MNRVDPDGRTDYFSTEGVFLYNDGRDNGGIRIISSDLFQSIFDKYGSTYEGDSRFADFEMISSLIVSSSLFGESVKSGTMSISGALNVYQYYNTTGEELVNSCVPKTMRFNAGNIHYIGINVENNANGELFDNSFNLINALDGHEGFHSRQFKTVGHRYKSYNSIPKTLRELQAIKAQRAHPSWNRTTQQYRNAVKRYENKILQKSNSSH